MVVVGLLLYIFKSLFSAAICCTHFQSTAPRSGPALHAAAMRRLRTWSDVPRISLSVGRDLPASIVRRKHVFSGLTFRLHCSHKRCPAAIWAPHTESTMPTSRGRRPCSGTDWPLHLCTLSFPPPCIGAGFTSKEGVKTSRLLANRIRDLPFASRRTRFASKKSDETPLSKASAYARRSVFLCLSDRRIQSSTSPTTLTLCFGLWTVGSPIHASIFRVAFCRSCSNRSSRCHVVEGM